MPTFAAFVATAQAHCLLQTLNANQWVTVDLESALTVCGVVTQGRGGPTILLLSTSLTRKHSHSFARSQYHDLVAA
jgi:hypothetical protein